MKFIQKDIDKRLLFMVITLLILLTAVTIYYAFAFEKLLKRYNKNQEVFGEITANAVVEQFNKTSFQNYKEYLESRYDELNTLNKNLRSELVDVKYELILLKSQIEYQKAREIGPTEQFRLFQSKNDEINKLNEKVKELCSDIEYHNMTNKQCFGVS